MAAFDTLEGAGTCVSRLIATPVLPSATELMDRTCIQAVNKTVNAGLPDCEALCMIEVDGEAEVVEREMEMVTRVANQAGAISVEQTSDPIKMARWTNARKSVMSALSRYGEKLVSVSLADDMAVPISRIPEAVKAFQEIAKRNDVIIGTYGHAADGNLHTKMLVDPVSQTSWAHGEMAVGEDLRYGHTTGRDGVRRARYRDIQGALLQNGTLERTVDHGRHQEGPGPGQHLQPWQDAGVGGWVSSAICVIPPAPDQE